MEPEPGILDLARERYKDPIAITEFALELYRGHGVFCNQRRDGVEDFWRKIDFSQKVGVINGQQSENLTPKVCNTLPRV
jgi:hypothetical protein